MLTIKWRLTTWCNYRCSYCIQDIINMTMKGHIGLLPLRYNMAATWYGEEKFVLDELVSDGVFSETERGQAVSSPAVIHYKGRRKPWNMPGEENNMYGLWHTYAAYMDSLRQRMNEKEEKDSRLQMAFSAKRLYY